MGFTGFSVLYGCKRMRDGNLLRNILAPVSLDFAVERLPSVKMVRFTLSGTEAVHQAVRSHEAIKVKRRLQSLKEHIMAHQMRQMSASFPIRKSWSSIESIHCFFQ